MKYGSNTVEENTKLMEYGLLIILFAISNIIYGLIFIIKSKLSIIKKVIYCVLTLAGIFPPLYLIFPIFQFTVFRKMMNTAG